MCAKAKNSLLSTVLLLNESEQGKENHPLLLLNIINRIYLFDEWITTAMNSS